MSQIDDFIDDESDARSAGKKKSQGLGTAAIVAIVVGACGIFMCCGVGVLIALLLPAVQQAREAARRTQSKTNLKQIALAAHNFDATYAHFPPRDLQEGDVRQSWMTELLPWIDQAALYGQINQQTAWDDPNNRGAMSIPVMTYLNPSLPDLPVDPVSGYAMAHYAGNSHIFAVEKPLRIGEITDGTSSTILAGSVAAGLKPWGDPENLRDPAAGIGAGPNQFLHAPGSGGAHILLMDGSVRFLSDTISPQVMEGLAKPSDGVVPQEF